MKLIDLFERGDMFQRVPQTRHVTMFFGGCLGQANSLEHSGFRPNPIGRKFLVLYSDRETASNVAGFKKCNSVVEVKNIPANHLQINVGQDNAPQDIWEAIDRLNNGEKITLKLTRALQAKHFVFLNKLRKQQRNKYS